MSTPETKLAVSHTRVLTNEADFDALQSDWDELLNDSNQSVYFLRWNWNRLWWANYAPQKSRLHLIACYDASGRLVGLAPLYSRKRSFVGINQINEVMFLGTGIATSTSEHLEVIARRGHEPVVAQAIADSLLRATDVDRLWLSEIPITSVILPHLRRALGPYQSLRICNRSHYVDTRGDWATFHRNLGKSMRYNVGYYTRRLFKLYDCKFRSIDRLEDLDPVIEAFVELHQARWQSKGQSGSFALPSFEAFLRNAVYSSCIEGRVKLWALDLNGRVAAVLLAFQDNGVAHYFQGGFDPAYARHSLGTVMCGLCIRACIESKDVNEFDFMGGDPSYKERWTQSSCDSVVLEWFPRNVSSQLVRISEVGESAGRSFLRLVTPDVLKQKIQSIRRKRLHPRKNP